MRGQPPYAARLFINGDQVKRTTADRFAVINPATESALGDVPAAGPPEVKAALASAQRGFEAWRRKTPWREYLNPKFIHQMRA